MAEESRLVPSDVEGTQDKTRQDKAISDVAVRIPVPRSRARSGSPSPGRAFGSPQQPVRLSYGGSMAAPEGSYVRTPPRSERLLPPPSRRLTRQPTVATLDPWASGRCPPPSLKVRKVLPPSAAAVGPRDSALDAHAAKASMSDPGGGSGVLVCDHRAANPPGSPRRADDALPVLLGRRADPKSRVIAVEKFAELLGTALEPLRAAQLAGSPLWPGKRRLCKFPEVPCDCLSGTSGSGSGTPEITGFLMDSDISSSSGDGSSECSSERG